jgi:hypothetical protein
MGAGASSVTHASVKKAEAAAAAHTHTDADANPTQVAPSFYVLRMSSDEHTYPTPREGVHPDVAEFPTSLVLRIDRECLTLLRANVLLEDRLLCHWNYHDIMCWGHTPNTFQFRVFDPTLDSEKGEKATYRWKTPMGVQIETALMATVLHLMARSKRETLAESEMGACVVRVVILRATVQLYSVPCPSRLASPLHC